MHHAEDKLGCGITSFEAWHKLDRQGLGAHLFSDSKAAHQVRASEKPIVQSITANTIK